MFEYLTEGYRNQNRLNELGALGWELVTVTCEDGIDFCYFKKPLIKSIPEVIWKGKPLSELTDSEFKEMDAFLGGKHLIIRDKNNG